jgi:ATP-binding cassette subfamily B protein
VLSRVDAREDSIVFNNVSFAYPERDELFTNFNMEIKSGTTIGVVGTTGSGKTTLTRFLLRFAEPSQGEIVWGDRPITDYTLSSLRDSIALVSQHVTLFPTTIRENIRYGKEDATDKDIEDAAVIAEAFDFIEALPKSWDTLVGEGGYRLSGGQRQRIAIARAIIKDAPLLILDEATSAVDNETEAALQRSIAKISQDRTTMIVAHRLSTVRNADRILVFENGSIIEQGTHDNLVDMSGKYATLWRVQTGSNIE